MEHIMTEQSTVSLERTSPQIAKITFPLECRIGGAVDRRHTHLENTTGRILAS